MRAALHAAVLLAAVAVAPGLTFAAGEAPRTVSAASPLATLPAQARGVYAVLRGDDGFQIGRITFEWRREGTHYEASSLTETSGVVAMFSKARVVQTSRGEITAAGLRPQSFRHEKPKGTESATLDWAQRTVSYRDRVEPLASGTQDPVSMYFQIALHLADRGALAMPIATGTKVETYSFPAPSAESLATAQGAVPTLRYQTRNGDDDIEIWYATSGGLLPLRIRIGNRKKGEVYDQRLVDAAPGAKP